MYAGGMYDFDGDGSPDGPYLDAGNGPYTHYVERANANCTDNNNTGTPQLPRCTIPGTTGAPLAAGSVVEVHGRYDFAHTSPRDLHVAGTAVAPVFIRGPSAAQRAEVTGSLELIGSTYVVIENMHFMDRDGDLSGGDCGSLGITDKNGARFDSSHIVVRHCELTGNLGAGGMGVGGYSGSTLIEHIVIEHNTIHDNGDVAADFDQDVHGIGVGDGVSHLWVLDNELYRNSGDGLQINGTHAGTHHIYVGRNTAYGNKQTGLWSKRASDVVFSQNTVHQHVSSNSSFGACMGYQYGPHRVWFLFNHLYDCEYGIGTAGDANVPGEDVYLFGNIIHDIFPGGAMGTPDTSNTAWKSAGIFLSDETATKHIYNNTLYNVNAGIVDPRGGDVKDIGNNIIANVASHFILFETPSASQIGLTLFDASGPIVWSGASYGDLAAFTSANPGLCSNCLQADPRFVAAASGDFGLQADSPALDVGVVPTWLADYQTLYGVSIAVDWAGRERPQSGWDLGALERP